MHVRPFAVVLGLAISCGPDLVLPGLGPETPPVDPPTTQAPPPDPGPAAGEVVPQILVGAGDIANCRGRGEERAEATAKLLDRVFADGHEGLVFTAGDNAYPDGGDEEFRDCYGKTWGRHKARTRPALGNHEYKTPGASGYFNYFGAVAGEPGKGWYSYDLGGWHVVVLNSNCSKLDGGCLPGSPQEQWLRADLAAQPGRCTIAVWHHPRFSSGDYEDNVDVEPLWRALDDFDVELLLTGHEHHYERFAPMTADGVPAAAGVRQFIVGTGGVSPREVTQPRAHSEVLKTGVSGVMKLTLRPDTLDWEFISIDGFEFTDAGTVTCR